ncbi:hypothetical protein BH09VER1_BH09VER1_39910 [soil metagenome]
MPTPRSRPQFKAAATQEEVPPSIPRPLSYVRTATVKALVWRHYALLLLCGIWMLFGLLCLAAGIAVYAGMIPKLSDDQINLVGPTCLAAGLLEIVTSIGCWLRAPWGRVFAFVLSFLTLLSFPFGTPLGLFALVVLFRSSQLFGENRFDGAELLEERQSRKKRHSAA